MDLCTHEVRSEHWKNVMVACSQRPAGQSIKSWLAENGVCKQSYYYWQRKFRRETFQQLQAATAAHSAEVTFAEIRMPESNSAIAVGNNQPVAVIKHGGFCVEISNDISQALLSMILQEVSHA